MTTLLLSPGSGRCCPIATRAHRHAGRGRCSATSPAASGPAISIRPSMVTQGRRSVGRAKVGSLQAAAVASSDGRENSVGSTARTFVADNFLPLGLLAGLVSGLLAPAPGQAAHALGLPKVATFGIFFLSGLSIKGADTEEAMREWPALLFGFVTILFLTPLVAPLVLRLPLQPAGLATGLALFRCMPTTLSSGVALTQALGGNTALALALTVGTNLAGIFTLPFMLPMLLGAGRNVTLSPIPLLVGLVKTILVPLLLGVSLKALLPKLAAFVAGNKKRLSLLSSAMLVTIPWTQVSCSRAALSILSLNSILTTVVAALMVHASVSLGNRGLTRLFGLGSAGGEDHARKLQQTLTIVGSGKTLPVSVAVISKLDGALGEAGVLIVPCVLAHISSILLDSLLVTRWKKEG